MTFNQLPRPPAGCAWVHFHADWYRLMNGPVVLLEINLPLVSVAFLNSHLAGIRLDLRRNPINNRSVG